MNKIFELISSTYLSLGGVVFWIFAGIIAIFSAFNLVAVVISPLLSNFKKLLEEDNSFVRRFILKPSATLSLSVFGSTLWLINTFTFFFDVIVLVKYTAGWLSGILLFAFFFLRFPQYILSIIVLGIGWKYFGFGVFVVLLIIHLSPMLIALMFSTQSEDDDLGAQYFCFGYQREIFLLAALCSQFLAVPFYIAFQTDRAGDLFSDLLGGIFLFLHFLHNVKYFSKTNTEKEFGADYISHLYKTSVWYYILLFLLSWFADYLFKMIDALGVSDSFCAVAVVSWLNVIAVIGFCVSMFRIIRRKIRE